MMDLTPQQQHDLAIEVRQTITTAQELRAEALRELGELDGAARLAYDPPELRDDQGEDRKGARRWWRGTT